MSEPLTYPVPWDVVARLAPHIANGTRADVESLYRTMASRMNPQPIFKGLEHLPSSPRCVLAANHYQRKGLWIAHIAAVLACGMADQYRCAPPIRWLVTANWPRWKMGPLAIPSPGDLLLPRVAHALWCYAVPFSGTNPARTGHTLRRLLKDTGALECPIGIFPEGARAIAGFLSPPLPGIGRLFTMLAERGWPVQPAAISEAGRFIVKFGPPIRQDDILAAPDAGQLVMDRIAGLL
jgi:1-acyl-sn-glycerol-3-phosphate acyltransferase